MSNYKEFKGVRISRGILEIYHATVDTSNKLDRVVFLLEKLVAIEEENFKIKHGREFNFQEFKVTQAITRITGGNTSKNKPTLPKV